MNRADPFAVDEARWLEALTREFGETHHISPNDGKWYAAAIDGSAPAITANSPGELAGALHLTMRGHS